MTRVVNDTVFVYTRLRSGNPGYLVAYHTGDEPVVINLSSIPHMSEEVNVIAYSPNHVQNGEEIQKKLYSNRVPMSSKSTLVLTFVQKE